MCKLEAIAIESINKLASVFNCLGVETPVKNMTTNNQVLKATNEIQFQ